MLKYREYKLIKPDSAQIARIDEIIEGQGGTVFQEYQLNKIVESEFDTDLYYFVDKPKNISNFSPVHIKKEKSILKRYHFKPLYDIPYAGFINESEIDFKEFSIGFLESITYSGLPKIGEEPLNGSITHNGETCVIDLSLDEDEIFNTIIQSKRRNMIRKAIKSNITVQSYFTEEGLDHFWPILSELHHKLGYEHLTEEYYRKLMRHYGPQKKAMVLVSFKEEQPISGIIVIGNANSMLYYKGASKQGIKNEGQGELLQWEAIKLAKQLQVKYYDLGNLQKEILPAIYRFKTGFSDRIIKYPVYTGYGLGYKILSKIAG